MITMFEKSHVCFVCVCWGNRMVEDGKRKCLHLWLGKAFGGGFMRRGENAVL